MDWGMTKQKKKGEESSNRVKTKANLLSTFYSILSDNPLPTCQVEEQDEHH
jgi:hypothetical protein